jgi:hypothetical protein
VNHLHKQQLYGADVLTTASASRLKLIHLLDGLIDAVLQKVAVALLDGQLDQRRNVQQDAVVVVLKQLALLAGQLLVIFRKVAPVHLQKVLLMLQHAFCWVPFQDYRVTLEDIVDLAVNLPASTDTAGEIVDCVREVLTLVEEGSILDTLFVLKEATTADGGVFCQLLMVVILLLEQFHEDARKC